MELPDLLACTLGQAKGILAEKGFNRLEIEITAPPREDIREFDDSFRVVRTQLKTDGTVVLLICKPL